MTTPAPPSTWDTTDFLPVEPSGLDVPEQEIWHAYRDATALIEDTLDHQMQRSAGVPHLYYRILARLSQAPVRQLRMLDLAADTKITRPRLTHAIKRLEKLGWVRRDVYPTDKRGRIAVLTDTGYEVLQRATPGHVAALQHGIFDRLTPEQAAQFGELCRIIAQGLESASGGAGLPWQRR
ncbi:MarR family transcriptional regulator [Streptomyces sp. NBC_01474]|uniref:MarR family winged helix-turn-helix transcriptional regulator n=1 Tax=Streptomyces sp. NBC_01474 TaxID=2903880 RepID=UPI002DD8AF4B|nr:MarR family transcriptional regulator [Streptomyces sp. NBC_01474]WSE01146.1 MarR family transcriptional regulator [Streptomyces sp. NBC_01474]